ncbi:MAG: nucleotide sugar dehydrogenase, partial [Bacteroidales bacterium]|nr:nucleotide sugar dehydrogenase [Bacteroidales bacterium]
MIISVIGAGYVGLSLSVLLSQYNTVFLVDVIKDKVEQIKNKISPIKDQEISLYLKDKKLDLIATLALKEAVKDAAFIIVATPTNYDEKKNYFDTSSVEEVIVQVLKINPTATIVIKSTIPVGYVNQLRQKFSTNNIMFSPEFLREGKALYDNLHPSRIIVGDKTEKAKEFANLLVEGAIDKDIPVLFMDSTEAEAVKLFANTYLAMRVTFFNELDTYAEIRGLDTKSIIDGVCLDP